MDTLYTRDMILGLLFSEPLAFVLLVGALVASITIHEFAHAWVADHLGDPTPRLQGRVTLNPLAHLDPVGSLALLLVGFGWGRPVVFDPYNLQNHRRDVLLIAGAGPLSNIVLALLIAITLPWWPIWLASAGQLLFSLNIVLAVFNLVPIHPLDGGKILAGLLPEDLAQDYDALLSEYGLWILLLLVFPWAGGSAPIQYLIGPVIQAVQLVLLTVAAAMQTLLGM